MATDQTPYVEALRKMFRDASLFDDLDPTACALAVLERIDGDLLSGMRNVARVLGPALQMAGTAIAEQNARAPVRARPTVVEDGAADTTRRIERDDIDGEPTLGFQYDPDAGEER